MSCIYENQCIFVGEHSSFTAFYDWMAVCDCSCSYRQNALHFVAFSIRFGSTHTCTQWAISCFHVDTLHLFLWCCLHCLNCGNLTTQFAEMKIQRELIAQSVVCRNGLSKLWTIKFVDMQIERKKRFIVTPMVWPISLFVVLNANVSHKKIRNQLKNLGTALTSTDTHTHALPQQINVIDHVDHDNYCHAIY